DGRLFVAPDCGHEVTVKRAGLFNEAAAGFYRASAAVAERRAAAVGATATEPTASAHEGGQA
ncbi:MAG TPA: hypothetical protein VFP19_07270, partial [Candidatus Limnocylindrales bacterium]|nr:hypothetical protein [Candidatus Limnocylindrales bacterium]